MRPNPVGFPRCPARSCARSLLAFNAAVMTPYRVLWFSTRPYDSNWRPGPSRRSCRILRSAPTRFNAPISQQRRVAAADLLARVKAVKDAYGVKVNDVVLAIVAGRCGTHLTAAELPTAPRLRCRSRRAPMRPPSAMRSVR